jgi:hypothetical protein
MPLFTQGNNINEVTFHTGVVVTVNLEKNTEVKVLLDNQFDSITESAAISMELPTPIPSHSRGGRLTGIPHTGQKVLCAKIGHRYVIIHFLAGLTEYGANDGKFILDSREEGEVIISTGGFENPTMSFKPSGTIDTRIGLWAAHTLSSVDSRSEIKAKSIYNITAGIRDKKMYWEEHPVTNKKDAILDFKAVYEGKQLRTAEDDQLRLEESRLVDVSPFPYNNKVITQEGHITYGTNALLGEEPGHLYELRTQAARKIIGTELGGLKKNVFTEVRYGLQDKHRLEGGFVPGNEYPGGTIYDFRLKDVEGSDLLSPLTYKERIGRLDGNISLGCLPGSGEALKGELYYKRIAYGGGVLLPSGPGDGWDKESDIEPVTGALQAMRESFGQIEDDIQNVSKSFYRKRIRSNYVNVASNIDYKEELCENPDMSIFTREITKGPGNTLPLESYKEHFGLDTITDPSSPTFYSLEAKTLNTSYNLKVSDSSSSIFSREISSVSNSNSTVLEELLPTSYTTEFSNLITGTSKQSIEMNETFIKISDRFGNYIKMDEAGIEIYSTAGSNTLKFSTDGITAAYGSTELKHLVTDEFTSWFNSNLSKMWIGNCGAPTPMHPVAKPSWETNFNLIDNFQTGPGG